MNPRLVAITGQLKGQVITLMAERSNDHGFSNQVAVIDLATNGQARLAAGQLVAAVETKRGAN